MTVTVAPGDNGTWGVRCLGMLALVDGAEDGEPETEGLEGGILAGAVGIFPVVTDTPRAAGAGAVPELFATSTPPTAPSTATANTNTPRPRGRVGAMMSSRTGQQRHLDRAEIEIIAPRHPYHQRTR